MAANPNVGADPQAGAGSKPSEPVSPQAQPPIESDVTKLLTEFGGTLKDVQSQLRGLQGRQDRSDNQFTDFQKQLARLSEYEKQGLTREEAIAEMQSDDAAESRWTNLEKKLDQLAERIAGGGTQANGQQSVAKVFEAVGLDVKDPRVASALLKQYSNADEVELAAYRLANQIKQSPNPNPAQNASLPGGAATSNGADPRLAQLDELMKKPTENRLAIRDLKAQLDKDGWKT